ncbi:MAG: PorV/PorQ family protein [Gemmatimonadales bacterium]
MRNRSLFFAVCLLAAASGAAQAQVTTIGQRSNTQYGTTAAEFLLMAPTARGAALGDAFSALSTDVSSLYYNPAGVSQMSGPEFNASTTSYIAQTRYSWVGVALPFGGGSRAVGFSFGTFGFSNQPVYTVDDPTGTSGNVYSVSETYIGLTYSQQFSDRFAAGFTAKYINDQLGQVSGTAFAVDFGTSFHANIGGRPIRAAFTIANLGTTLKHTGEILDVNVLRPPPTGQQDQPQAPAPATLRSKDWPLPIQFRVALAYDLFNTSMSRFSLLGQFTQPNNNEPVFGFGGEYEVQLGTSGFKLTPRASYTYQPANSFNPAGASDPSYAGFNTTITNGSYGLAYGGGISYRKNPRGFGFGVDYALKSFGPLGNTNVVSLGLTW